MKVYETRQFVSLSKYCKVCNIETSLHGMIHNKATRAQRRFTSITMHEASHCTACPAHLSLHGDSKLTQSHLEQDSSYAMLYSNSFVTS